MAYTGGEYSIQTIFELVKEQAILERIERFNEYVELIDDILQEKILYGFFDPNEDLEQIRQDLELRWPEVEKALKKKAGKLVA